MKQELKKIISKLHGNIIIIGFDSINLTDYIDKNNNIISCDFLNLIKKTKSNELGSYNQTINIKKLRKKYKKKKLDYIIVDMDDTQKYVKYFIKDSIYICKDKIFIFNSNLETTKHYERYNVKISANKTYLDVDISNATNNVITDLTYLIYDTVTELLDKISEILIS